MLFITISVSFALIAMFGVGRLSAGIFLITPQNPLTYIWIGFFTFTSVTMGVSIIQPVKEPFLLFFILAGLAGGVLFFNDYAQRIRFAFTKKQITFVVITVGLLFLTCSLLSYSEWPEKAYDTDLYHANIVRWLNEYGTPPGLANVHSRLGMNSSWLTLAAVFNNGLWEGRVAWLMPGVSIIGFFLYFFHGAIFDSCKKVKIFCTCMSIFLFVHLSSDNFPSLYFDAPSVLLSAVAVAECIRLVYSREVSAVGQSRLVLCLIASAFTIKSAPALSVVIISGLVCFVGIFRERLSARTLATVFAPAAAAGVIWLSRNILLSGYPLFPLPFLVFPVDWAIPQSIAQGTYDSVIGWARQPGPSYWSSLIGWEWVSPWLSRHMTKGILVFTGIPFALGTVLWLTTIKNGRPYIFFFFIWGLSNIIFWFFTAPDLRFGKSFFEIYFASAAAFAFSACKLPTYLRRPSELAFLLVAFVCCGTMVGVGIKKVNKVYRSAIMVGTIPSRAEPFKILDKTGEKPLMMFRPKQHDDARCGDSPLPCTPYEGDIFLRIPGDLRGGFRR